jgi:hypothetical protein
MASEPSTPSTLSLTDGPSSRYYAAMSEPAMVSWSTGEVRRMRSVLEMRLGVLACGSLDRDSLIALRDGDAASSSPLSLSPASLTGSSPRAPRKKRGAAAACSSGRSLSPSDTPGSSSVVSSGSSAETLPPPARADSVRLLLFDDDHNRAHDDNDVKFDKFDKYDIDEVDGSIGHDDDDDDDDDDHDDDSLNGDGSVDVFGIRIPCVRRNRSNPRGYDDEEREHDEADEEHYSGADSDEAGDLGNIRRHLLPQLVAFVAESPSKLDLSGLLC